LHTQFYEFGAFQSTGATIDVWATNSTLQSRHAMLELRFVDLHTGEDTHPALVQPAALAPNASTELITAAQLPRSTGAEGAVAAGSTTVIVARLLDAETQDVIARTADWPQPFAAVAFPADPGVRVSLISNGDGDEVHVTATRPVKALVLGVQDDDEKAPWSWDDGQWEARMVKWSDNALDIVPGEEQVVRVEGRHGRSVTVAHMGSEQARVV
jgi:beta-mannosidase